MGPADLYLRERGEGPVDRVMVVGASGLVGSHLVSALRRECIVHSLARSDTGSGEHAAEHHTVDLTSDLSTAELPEEIDAVVYLAQSDRFRDMPEQAVHVHTVNTTAVVAMMDYARQAGARKFIFASTGGVYPDSGMTRSEQMPVYASADRDYYSATKLCSEILLEAMADQVEVTILRIFFAYGRGQREEMLLPRLVSRVRSGMPITLRGRDGFSLNPVHVSDVVGAIRAALSLPGSHTVNVAGPEVYTLRQITTAIGERLGREPVFEIEEDGAEPAAIVGDISLMSQLLTPPRKTFMEGLEDLLQV